MNSNECLLSIVIPIFKVEKYINQCIDSIIIQNRSNIEIILVDDGSPDNCPIICDAYASNIMNIKVIHQKNKGLSEARNTGIKESKGNYIWFIDSDDYILPNSIDIVINSIKENPHINIFSSHLNILHEKTNSISIAKGQFGKTYFNHEYLWKGLPEGAVQRFVFKKEFIIKNKLLFKPQILHEDALWSFQALYLAKEVHVLHSPIYVYRIREEGSIMSGIKIKSAYDLILGHKILIDFMNKHVAINDRKKYRKMIYAMIKSSDRFCRHLYKTKEYDDFLKVNLSYIRHETIHLLKFYPYKIIYWLMLIHPYKRIKIIRIIKHFTKKNI